MSYNRTIIGPKIIFGIPAPAEMRIIINIPPTVRSHRLVFRPRTQARLYLRYPDGIECWDLIEEAGHWSPCHRLGYNRRYQAMNPPILRPIAFECVECGAQIARERKTTILSWMRYVGDFTAWHFAKCRPSVPSIPSVPPRKP